MPADSKPYPKLKTAILFILVLTTTAVISMIMLLSVDDPVRLKALIEDDGPVQMVGQIAIALAFALCLVYSVVDRSRYSSYLQLSYLLMFYTLREADYHYKVSEHAKASQFKRFFSHELIPISSKLFLASIVILFLIVAFRCVRDGKAPFLVALRAKLPWAIFVFLWGLVAFLSQAIDQIPYFHTAVGQVYEEVFEASAEILMLCAVILFRMQLYADRRGYPIP